MNLEEESVKRGAALLDERLPGWEAKINQAMFDGSFDMGCWDHCVAGQLELVSYEEPTGTLGICIVLNGIKIVDDEEAADYGFVPFGEGDDGWSRRFTELWKEEVNKRIRTPLPN